MTMAPPVLIEGWLPPSRENWELLVKYFQVLFPVFASAQFITDWYPMGKTSIASRFNLPPRLAWFIMDVPGVVIVTYCMFALPAQLGLSNVNFSTDPDASAFAGRNFNGLPLANWTLAGAYFVHYMYRAVVTPIIAPSMSPIHAFPFASAFFFQVCNGISIGGWLAGHGPIFESDWSGKIYALEVGLIFWAWGLLANFWHDDELREIRRQAKRQRPKDDQSVDKVYLVPQNALFEYILYPHYLCEWIEWTGWWCACGWGCVPARTFVVNEIFAMLPRALAGRRWYINKFGAEKIGKKKAVIPGLL